MYALTRSNLYRMIFIIGLGIQVALDSQEARIATLEMMFIQILTLTHA